MELVGIPVIMHCIKAFADYSPAIKLIVVLPDDHMEDWNNMIKKHPIGLEFELCAGGKTRFDSVKNGLDLVDGDGLVAIHDAVRPLVSVSLIKKCYDLAAQKGNSIPVIPLTDSAREVNGDDSRPIDRDKFRLVQTPQVFDVNLIKKAYEQAYRSSFSDDATVAESFGAKVYILEGERRNIKITTPDDLTTAASFLK